MFWGEGSAGDTNALQEKYPHTFMPNGALLHSLEAQGIVKEKQKELLKDHDWVLYSDMDEFVIPTKHKDLKEYMLSSKEEQPYCEGFEICQAPGEKQIDYLKPYLKQRKYWIKDITGSYNKPLLSRVESNWVDGMHKLDGMEDNILKEIQNTGLVLVHIRWGNPKIKGENYPEHIEKGIERRMVIPQKIRRAF